ncbi:ImmA/IrrE family metallo-endopeptidase [Microbacterium sp. LCT-H2]|uniref:ImmA/IrrE family metallo-endopeptidase n=1 Tax=Microbacterium sp. LCT-H2 TaxID=1914306 RepID=UPI0009F30FE8|nr:ImmA/IrrE family metallo-endopeptidase [Microbacterium sp. LCT-H2]
MGTSLTPPANLSNAAINQLAQSLSALADVHDASGRANLDALLERVNGKISFDPNPWGDESSIAHADGTFEIFLPRLTSARRDRFTVAHELGHLFLHHRMPRATGEAVFHRGGRGRAETEANIFAAALLMPAEQFRVAHEEVGGDEWALARRFDVSPAAARVRAEVLDLA